jgi:glycosyltransferase involved in cell wall biosynthesis
MSRMLGTRVEYSHGVDRFLARFAQRWVRHVERRLAQSVHAIMTFSPLEAREWARDTTAPVIQLDPPLLRPAQRISADQTDALCLFVGAFQREENLDGARWLLDEIWPRVMERLPSAKLAIVGSSPSQDISRRASASVTVTGYVASLDDWYDAARVVVAPLRLGAGVRFKVVQALMWERPVVSTRLGAAGIADRVGNNGFVAITDDPAEFAECIVRTLRSPSYAAAVGAEGSAFVERRYDFGRGLDDLLIALEARHDPGRHG